jgi:hypothetical protein
MAVNNIYFTLQDQIYKRYTKVPINVVGGLRVDPTDPRLQIGWVLKTDEDSFDFATKKRTKFVYDNEVIEVYSESEDKLFRKLNSGLFRSGLLKEYNEENELVDSPNFVNDAEILRVIEIRSVAEFEAALKKFDAVATLERIKQQLVDQGKSVKKVQLVEARLKEVRDVVD